ncbi:MAG: ATP synthase F1 subunit delta [Bryobacteraceae bacterium]
MLSVVATRYGRALADVVVTANIDGAVVLSALRQVEDVIEGSAELRAALLSPAVSPVRKRAVVQRILQPLGLPDKVTNFVNVLIDHRRVKDLKHIVDAFEQLLDERLGYIGAVVRSAKELTGAQQASIETQVSRVSGKKAKVKFITDSSMIGGVVARVGSTVYDGSVRGQLERLRTKLA